jgi:hypothetical protein
LFAGRFQHWFDGGLLDNLGLYRIVPGQIDDFFDRYRLGNRLRLRHDHGHDRLRFGRRGRRRCSHGRNWNRCNRRSDYRRNDRHGSH